MGACRPGPADRARPAYPALTATAGSGRQTGSGAVRAAWGFGEFQQPAVEGLRERLASGQAVFPPQDTKANLALFGTAVHAFGILRKARTDDGGQVCVSAIPNVRIAATRGHAPMKIPGSFCRFVRAW